MLFTCYDCKQHKSLAELHAHQRHNFLAGATHAMPRCIECREKRRSARESGLRICITCKETKPFADFSPRTSKCRACAAKIAHDRSIHLFNEATVLKCPACKIVKPKSEFPERKSYSDRRHRRCNQCLAKRSFDGRSTEFGRFRNAKAIATYRGIPWRLSEENYTAIRKLPCHYCGGPLLPGGLALDRKDSADVYRLENVVPCCGDCNTVKGVRFTVDEMMILGEAMRKIMARRAR